MQSDKLVNTPPGGPVCTLAWVEARVAEIHVLREEMDAMGSESWQEANDHVNVKITALQEKS